VVLPSPSRQVPGYDLPRVGYDRFLYILSNSLFTSHLCIQRSIISDTDSIENKPQKRPCFNDCNISLSEPFRIYLYLAHTTVLAAWAKRAPEIECDGSQNSDTAMCNRTRQMSRLTEFWMCDALWYSDVEFLIVSLIQLLFSATDDTYCVHD
jgi:hypothetical protein